jgi:hypothetical protein
MIVRQCLKTESDELMSPYYSSDSILINFKLNQPPRSECAVIGKRALSWAPWIPGISSNTQILGLDQKNLEFSHEHIFWGDLKSNLGWGPSGFFSESANNFNYRYEDKCYDGSLMREAMAIFRHNYRYNFITNNCQTFIDNLRRIYQSLANK